MSVLSEIIHNFVNVGGAVSLLVVIFLISKIRSKDQLFSSCYFILYGISLIVQITNVLIWELWTIWLDDDVIHLLDNIIFNYESGFVGFWNVLLAMNRCTIFVFPIWHAKIWQGLPLFCCTAVGLLLPIILYLCLPATIYCLLAPVPDDDCLAERIQNQSILTFLNSGLAIASFVLGAATVMKGCLHRKSALPIAKTSKFELRLLVQSICSTIILIFYWMALLLGIQARKAGYENARKIFNTIGDVTYILFHVSGIIVLLIVSKTFRRSFINYYRSFVYRKSDTAQRTGGTVTQTQPVILRNRLSSVPMITVICSLVVLT